MVHQQDRCGSSQAGPPARHASAEPAGKAAARFGVARNRFKRSSQTFVLAALLHGAPALADGGPSENEFTGNPESTITAPNTTATGVTKPPGSLGPATPAEKRDLNRIEKQDDKIDKGICDDCDP